VITPALLRDPDSSHVVFKWLDRQQLVVSC
jgi:hypothetical protein